MNYLNEEEEEEDFLHNDIVLSTAINPSNRESPDRQIGKTIFKLFI